MSRLVKLQRTPLPERHHTARRGALWEIHIYTHERDATEVKDHNPHRHFHDNTTAVPGS